MSFLVLIGFASGNVGCGFVEKFCWFISLYSFIFCHLFHKCCHTGAVVTFDFQSVALTLTCAFCKFTQVESHSDDACLCKYAHFKLFVWKNKMRLPLIKQHHILVCL